MASALVGLTVSATTSRARSCPSHPARIAVWPRVSAASFAARSSAVIGIAQSASSDSRPAMIAWPSTMPWTPRPSRLAKSSTGLSWPGVLAGGVCDRFGNGVFGGVFEGTDEAEHLVAVGAVDRDDIDECHLTGGDGAGLVEHDGVDPSGRLEDLWSFDEDPELRPASGADEQCCRCCQAECARAGDDQHGDRCGEGGGRGLAGSQPEAERSDREGDDHGDEHGGDLVGEALHGGLAVLGFGDQLWRSGRGRCRPRRVLLERRAVLRR